VTFQQGQGFLLEGLRPSTTLLLTTLQGRGLSCSRVVLPDPFSYRYSPECLEGARSRKLRQVLYLIILTLLRNTAGLTSTASWDGGAEEDEA
jgi:hypothetical protein